MRVPVGPRGKWALISIKWQSSRRLTVRRELRLMARCRRCHNGFLFFELSSSSIWEVLFCSARLWQLLPWQSLVVRSAWGRGSGRRQRAWMDAWHWYWSTEIHYCLLCKNCFDTLKKRWRFWKRLITMFLMIDCSNFELSLTLCDFVTWLLMSDIWSLSCILSKDIKKVEKCRLPGRYKAWMVQHMLMPRLMWPLSIYNVPMSTVEAIQRLITQALKRWLGLPKTLSTACFSQKTTTIQFPYSELTEEVKARNLVTLTGSKDSCISGANIVVDGGFKVILKNCQKIEKITSLTVKNWIFKKRQKSSISYGKMFSQPKYHIPTWKSMTGSLKPKIY